MSEHEIHIGDVIPLNERSGNIVRVSVKHWKIARAAFAEASGMLVNRQEELFDAVRECHPELAEFDLTIEHHPEQIVVMSRRNKDNRI